MPSILMVTLCGLLAVICIALVGNTTVFAAENTPAPPPDSQGALPQPGQKAFPYANPVYAVDAPDPALLRAGDDFYAAVTGQRIIRSRDLVHWEPIGWMFSNGYPRWVDANSPEFIWAPDLQFIDGKYVLYFSARKRTDEGHHMGIGAAWSKRPEGPFIGLDEPLVSGPGFGNIDPFVFQDDDGTLYMYWGSDHQPIYVQPMASDGLSLVGQPQVALLPLPFLRYSKLVEAPWVIRRGDYYYLFWSGDHFRPGDYGVSVARALSPFGPFVRFPGNPILESSDAIASPGHHAMIQDDAGQDWFLYHAYDWVDTSRGRMLHLDRVEWKDGWPVMSHGSPNSSPMSDGPIWATTAIPSVEVAFGKSVQASSSRTGHSAPMAVDIDPRTSWLPDPKDETPWLIIDLGEHRRVTKVELWPAQGIHHPYVIESSLDGVNWVLINDRDQTEIPFRESTARYVRVSSQQPVRDEKFALRRVRVFAYEHVWIAKPETLGPMTSPKSITPYVNPQLDAKQMTVTIDEKLLYKGTPTRNPIVSPHLSDGWHRVVLEVIDANQAVWKHDVSLEVRNAMIASPKHGATLNGRVTVQLITGYDDLQNTIVSLTPIRDGVIQEAEKSIVWQSKTVPGNIDLNTTDFADGTYRLQFAVTTNDGHMSVSEHTVILNNWNVLQDPFEPPHISTWLGTVDRKKTVEESEGWSYDDSDPAAFFNDRAEPIRFFKLSVGDRLGPDVFQLGHVELMFPVEQ